MVMDGDDVWAPQRRGQVGLPVEPLAKLGVGRHIGRENLERVAARQPWVLGQVDLTHRPRLRDTVGLATQRAWRGPQ